MQQSDDDLIQEEYSCEISSYEKRKLGQIMIFDCIEEPAGQDFLVLS
jgi:hypothetical protein